MEDTILGEEESEIDEIEGFPTDSVMTITSSQFQRMSIEQRREEEEEEEEGEAEDEKITIEPFAESQQVSVNLTLPGSRSTTQTPEGLQSLPVSERTLLVESFSKTFQPASFEDSFSAETLTGPQHIPALLAESESILGRVQQARTSSKQRSPHVRPVPFYSMEMKRLKGKEKYDVFSEDEEPVMRTSYTPQAPKEPECPPPVVREETLFVYNVREGVPTSPISKISKSNKQYNSNSSGSNVFASRASIVRRNTRLRTVASGSLDWKLQDLTPHQRELRNVSFEELSSAEVAIIKGLWKCITYNLWSFGALTTINFFRIRGHIAFNDQKATPEVMMQCHFLWPHADKAMKSLEAVVLNLHKPEESHKLVYELGKKHGKLKIPLSETQSEMVINSFLYTFHQHVHPKMTLKELNILRKFSNITMFLFMDASRWDSEPLPLF